MGKEQDLISASKSGDIQHVRKILSKLRKSVSSSQLDTAADVGRNGKMKKTKSTTGMVFIVAVSWLHIVVMLLKV
jgi:hypothetical protein